MNMKRLLPLLLPLLVVPILLFGIYLVILVDTFADDPENSNKAIMSIGSFNVIETSTIDPTTILSSLNHGDQNVFNFELGFPPDDPPFVTSIEWKQADFLNLATNIFRAAWNESANDWKIYIMGYFTECDHPYGFSSAEIYFYSETSNHIKYSTRGIDMQPEYGYVMLGGDRYYYRPFFGWKSMNLKEMTVTAEEALRRAEASGGMKARQSWENKCTIVVQLWPEAYGRYDWRVDYWDDNIYNKNSPLEIWIPSK